MSAPYVPPPPEMPAANIGTTLTWAWLVLAWLPVVIIAAFALKFFIATGRPPSRTDQLTAARAALPFKDHEWLDEQAELAGMHWNYQTRHYTERTTP